MILLNFGKWLHKAGNVFIYDRIITNRGKELPFIIARFRHVGKYPT